jgi:hypothetical protein
MPCALPLPLVIVVFVVVHTHTQAEEARVSELPAAGEEEDLHNLINTGGLQDTTDDEGDF